MYERQPDFVICISVEEYKDLLTTRILYENMRCQYWELKPKYDKLLDAITKPTFGEKEDDDEVNS